MHELILLGVGFLAAFIGSMSGGGAGLLSIFTLLSLGMPINQAIATNKLGDLGFFFPALRNLVKAKQINKRALVLIVLVNLAGVTAGTFLVSYLNIEILSKLVVGILVLLVVLNIFHKEIATTARPKKWYWPVIYFFTAISAGALGAGTGILSTLTLVYFRGFNILRAMAHSFFASLFGWSLSASILLFSGLINYRYAAVLFVGNTVGAHFGSKIAIKKGSGFVRYMVIALALCLLLQLLLK